MQFGDFAGNEEVKKLLSSLVDSGHIPHALLLEGDEGTGRRTLAMQIARAAVCEASDGMAQRPCGRCTACGKSVHPDVARWGNEEHPLTVDGVRQLRQEAFTLPNEASCRVLILENAQNMTPQAQNALLKILEEPPAHVRFILTCNNRAQLLETIRSRCMCLTLQPVPWEQALPALRRALPQQSEEQLRRAHSLFGGRIGGAIAGVTDGTLQQVLDLVPRMAAALTAPNELELLRLTAPLEKERELTQGVLGGLQLVFRDALALRYGAGGEGMSTAPEQARQLAGRLTGRQLMALMAQIEQLQNALRHNMNNTLFLTRLCACLRRAAGNE